MSFGVNLFSSSLSAGSGVGSSSSSGQASSSAEMTEYKTLLDKKSKGKLTTNDYHRLNELESKLSSSGKLNADGSLKTGGRNNDKVRAAARRMSWDEVASIWSSQPSSSTSRIVQKTVAQASGQQARMSGGMMSMNGSIFGRG